MIFVDSNVLIYALGAAHPNRDRAEQFLADALEGATPLAISTEVLQELLYFHGRRRQLGRFDATMVLVHDLHMRVVPVELDDLMRARRLLEKRDGAQARDAIHCVVASRLGASNLFTFDAALAQLWHQESGRSV